MSYDLRFICLFGAHLVILGLVLNIDSTMIIPAAI